MTTKLNAIDRLNAISDYKPKIAVHIERKLMQDHNVPQEVARAAAAGVLATAPSSDFDDKGAMQFGAFERTVQRALEYRDVKAAIATAGQSSGGSDRRAPHELSMYEVLLADQRRFDALTPAQQLAERRARGEIV